jgi:nucleoside-diphosphate-sugar epimerase
VTPGVLVTGVTGFVGREVARGLLAAGRPLAVLARARDGVPADTRVATALGLPPGDERVSVIEGDLGAPACGVNAAGWHRLRASIETVIHCAGDTAFAPDRLEPYETAHVGGPRRLLEGLAPGRLRRWVHVSTAYVCGRREGLIRECEGDEGQAFHNVYERVKLASESAVRAAGAHARVDVRIARPGIVVGAAPVTGGGAPSNLFFDFVRMTAALAALGHEVPLRIEAAAHAPFNFVPVDYVAAALIRLADMGGLATGIDSHGGPEMAPKPPDARGTPGNPGRPSDAGPFHLVAHDAPTQAAVLATIAERLGVSELSLVDRLDGPTPLERRVARMLQGYRQYLTHYLVFDDENARRVLPPEILRRATLSRTTLHALIDLALTTEERPATEARRVASARGSS